MSDLSQMIKVDPATVLKAASILIENAPQAIKTGGEMLAYLELGVRHLMNLFAADAPPTTVDDIKALLDKETLQAIHIASIT